MSTAADLRFYYPSKYLTADGQALTTQTTTGQVAGSEKRAFVDTNLTNADDYWNGAIIKWESGNNAGEYSHVKDWTNSTNTMDLYKDVPYDIEVGDTYKLILGGNWRSSEEVPGLTIQNPTVVDGFEVIYAGYENGAGNGTISYNPGTEEMYWTAPGGTTGTSVSTAGLVGGDTFYLFDDDDSKWIEVKRVASSSSSSASSSSSSSVAAEHTLILTQPSGIFVPDFEGIETLAGKTRYHLLVVRNIHSTDKLYDVRTYVYKSVANAAATTCVNGIGQTIETLECADLTNWPTSGWIYNSDKDDIRYYYNRSGNRVRVQERTGVLRGKTNTNWNASDNVELWPEFDIGLDAPSTGQFENPATEETAPSGVVFSTPTTVDDALTVGTLDVGDIYGIWIQEVVVEATRARPNVISLVKFKLDVSGI